ncbi:MAG: RND transporter [Verrucomicrobia bacterium]|nr:MAG: RND transporter [Verrucomicrobiota bacterium]
MKLLSSESFFGRLLTRLVDTVVRRPNWFLYPQLALFAVCVGYTVKYLEIDTSRNDLVGGKKKYHQNFLKFKKEFPTQDDLVVVVESENGEKNRQFVERLGRKLEAETNYFRDVFYKGDLKMLGSKALLFVPENDLKELKRTLHDFEPFVQQFTKTTNLVSLFDMINTQFRTAKQEQNAQNESLAKSLPALERIVQQATASLKRPGAPPSPGVMALFNAGEEAEREIYITFGNGTMYLVTVQAPTSEQNAETVERLRELVEETRREVPGLNVGLTGEPVLEIDEMRQSERDTALATVVSFALVFVIIIFGYGRISRRIKADFCLIVGMAYTMAFTTLAIGHLNILTITFAPILVGIAIDFGVHLIARYEEELRRGRSAEEAMRTAMVLTGQGIFTGAFTTAGAFFAMWFTDFKGIQEMGIICGGGMLICLVPMLTLLPVLILRGRSASVEPKPHDKADYRERIEKFWLNRPRTVIAVTAVLCLLSATQLRKIFFDYNLLNMQSAGLPAVVFEEKLIYASTNTLNEAATNAAGRSVLFAAVYVNTADEAAKLAARIKQLPVVADVDSIASYLLENPVEKLKLIGEIKAELAPLQFLEPDPADVNLDELSRTLYSTGGYLGLARDAVQAEDADLARQFGSFRESMNTLRIEMLRGSPAQREAHAQTLGAFQRALFNDLRETFEALRSQDDRGGLRIEDLPMALRHRFVGVTGKHLVQVYPRENVWQREHQQKFVHELRQALDPKETNYPIITGTPVQLLEYTSLLKKSYEEAALYSLLAIALLVFFHFRSVVSVGLALLPVAVGSIWLAGIMGYFGIPFNPANIMTLPLVIGIGVTNGIHILNRFAEEQTPSILGKSTGKAVLVSGLTTVAGFGSLALAKHRGIESLGYVMATGVATCMIAGLTVLPAILRMRMRTKLNPEKNQPSVVNAQTTLGREEPR